MSKETTNDRKCISITWHIDDVKSIRPDLTDAQARRVLWFAKEEHDANIGINWEVLGAHADAMFGKQKEGAA